MAGNSGSRDNPCRLTTVFLTAQSCAGRTQPAPDFTQLLYSDSNTDRPRSARAGNAGVATSGMPGSALNVFKVLRRYRNRPAPGPELPVLRSGTSGRRLRPVSTQRTPALRDVSNAIESIAIVPALSRKQVTLRRATLPATFQWPLKSPWKVNTLTSPDKKTIIRRLNSPGIRPNCYRHGIGRRLLRKERFPQCQGDP